MPAPTGGAAQAGTPARSAEYDAFGPWVDPVRTPEDVPRLYRGRQALLDGARLVLKVPRDIPRRDATPDMDLYDHLLVLHDDALTVLSRRDGTVDERRVPTDRVAAVRTSVDLLDGALTLHDLDGRPLSVRFSGSSADVVEDLVDRLRAAVHGRTHPHGGQHAAAPAPLEHPAGVAGSGAHAGTAALLDPRALGEQEVGLVAVHREVARREPGLRTLALHPRRTLTPVAGGLARLTHLLRPMTVHAAIVCTDGADLQVFGRRVWLARGRTPVHSWSRLVVPLDRLGPVTTTPDRRYVGLLRVRLAVGATTVELPVPAGSDVPDVLAGLAAHR